MTEDTSTTVAAAPMPAAKKVAKPRAKAKPAAEPAPKKTAVRKRPGVKVAASPEVVKVAEPKTEVRKAPASRAKAKEASNEGGGPVPEPRAHSAPAQSAPPPPPPVRETVQEASRPALEQNVQSPQSPQSEHSNRRSDSRPQGQHSQQGQPQQRQQGEGSPQGESQQRWGGRDRRRDRHGRHRNRDRDRNQGRDQNRDQQQSGDPQNRDNQRVGPRHEHQRNSDAQTERPPQPERPLGPPEPAEGILELSPKGYGFLRQKDRGYAQTPNDAFVSPEQIRKFGLREGMLIKGEARKGHRGPQMTEISEVNARPPEEMRDLPLFEELKAINPNKRILFETVPSRLTTRTIDLITPVGRGQRGLIVAPPRAGKTTLLQHIAEAVTQLHPQLHLMVLLVDERPEEVTEFKRLLPKAEIFASSNDMDLKSHTRIATFAIERAKRLVECGQHVFILMDSITRMARAFNNSSSGGATMSGGVGVGALEIPRRLFAAARNTRTAGSITILATALIETGSRMDDLIFQEFKGTGNMELVLDRRIAEQYVFPAVNVLKSGTRREELLVPAFQLEKIHMLRRGLAGHKPIEAMQRVTSLLERFPSNSQMLVELPSR